MQTKRVAVFLRTILHVWFRSKIDIRNFSNTYGGVVLIYFCVLAKIGLCFQILIINKGLKCNWNFWDNPGHDISAIYFVSVEVWFTPGKRKFDL